MSCSRRSGQARPTTFWPGAATDAALGLILLLALWFVWDFALEPDLPAAPPGVLVGEQQIWEDVSTTATWKDVLDGAAVFEPVGDRVPNFGFRSSAFWMRLTVTNTTGTTGTTGTRQLYAAVSGALLDDVQIFVRSADGRVQMNRTGSSLSAVERPVPEAARLMLLPFKIHSGETVEVYLRLHTPSGESSFPLRIIDERAMYADVAADEHSHGILLGIFVSIFAYNMLLWIFLRDHVYAAYSGYLACTFAVSSIVNGNGATFFYPHLTWPTQHLVVPLGGMSIWFLVVFTRLFLRTADHPHVDRPVRALGVLALLLVASAPILPRPWTMGVIGGLIAVIPLGGVTVGIIAWQAGKTEARFYLAGHACGVVALTVTTGLTMGVAPIVRATVMAFSYGTAADGALLAFALADRIRVLQRDRRRAEQRERAALASRAAELERLVAERTAEIENMAVTDSLTGVANRYGVSRAWSRIEDTNAEEMPYAILMIDLDRFKLVNDRFGHDEGDRVLRDVASELRNRVRSGDTVGRVGGEEFVMVCFDVTIEQAVELAEQIRSDVATSVAVGDPPTPVTTSIGVAAGWVPSPEGADQVRRRADRALYRAKALGRNRVVLSDPQTVQVKQAGRCPDRSPNATTPQPLATPRRPE